MTTITEADVEQAALDWLSALGWKVAHGPEIAPGTPNAERTDYGLGGAGASGAGLPRRAEPEPAASRRWTTPFAG